MQVLQLNHVALHVADLGASTAFYGGVLGLTPIPRPAFSFPGAWFAIGPVGLGQELHLIGRDRPKAGGEFTPPRERHWAMCVDSVAAAADRLRERGVAFDPPVDRPDGAKQIFLRDPDGHVVELCELPRA